MSSRAAPIRSQGIAGLRSPTGVGRADVASRRPAPRNDPIGGVDRARGSSPSHGARRADQRRVLSRSHVALEAHRSDIANEPVPCGARRSGSAIGKLAIRARRSRRSTPDEGAARTTSGRTTACAVNESTSRVAAMDQNVSQAAHLSRAGEHGRTMACRPTIARERAQRRSWIGPSAAHDHADVETTGTER